MLDSWKRIREAMDSSYRDIMSANLVIRCRLIKSVPNWKAMPKQRVPLFSVSFLAFSALSVTVSDDARLLAN